MSVMAMFRQLTFVAIRRIGIYAFWVLWNHAERHVARQCADRRGHGDVACSCAGRNDGCQERVCSDGEVRWHTVEINVGGPRESLAEDAARLTNLAEICDKPRERPQPDIETEDCAPAVSHRGSKKHSTRRLCQCSPWVRPVSSVELVHYREGAI